ncbi:Mitogen-activated_protein kinase [Hexamita inflata]|uniref:Mitogen-activated protein kinase n=1 Tax=Hexamita inflata TaxID=28002 RepID=A0AA86R1K6_9EUKA|nr:Mitogen-activated protein kinase [Hexamita inflata]
MPYVTTNIKGVNFTVPEYYKIGKMLGQGAYGIVVDATDTRSGSIVAIKKLEKVFSHLVDAKRILREITLLRHLAHDNIAYMLDFIAPQDTKNLDELYLVFGFMESDMSKIISTRQALTEEHVQFFMYQLLRGLAYIHSAGVVHRDLKPANLLLNSDAGLQICDFGLARLGHEMSQTDTKMTEYVSTRWYRAPEVIMGDPKYGQAIDIFSSGCIFAELILRTPLFPGRDYINQLHLVMDVLGTPSAEFLSRIDNMSARQYVEQLPKQQPIDLKKKFPNASPEALDLLKLMLKMDAKDRPSAGDCMRHKYFEGIWDEADLLLYKEKAINLFFEEKELTRDLLELGFLNEAKKFHPELQTEVQARAQKLGIQVE